MGAAKKTTKAATKKTRKVNEKQLIEKALTSLEGKLDQEGMKGSVGDMLRLLEFRKQLRDDGPKDVKVTWVDEQSSE